MKYFRPENMQSKKAKITTEKFVSNEEHYVS